MKLIYLITKCEVQNHLVYPHHVPVILKGLCDISFLKAIKDVGLDNPR